MNRVLVLLSLCLGLSVAPVVAETMTVPGGRDAVAKLLGFAPGEPDRFYVHLNRVLLTSVRADHDWIPIPQRSKLVVYIEAVDQVEQEFSTSFTLEGPAAQDDFLRLAHLMGYTVQFEVGGPVLEAREGDKWRIRREVAQVLGWTLPTMGADLMRGQSVRVELKHEQVAAPMPFARWSEIVGRPVDAGNALLEMAQDQRFGLFLEGLRRITDETEQALDDQSMMPWLYAYGTTAFYRYAPAIDVRDGGLVVPGGARAREFWQRLTGVSPDFTIAFVLSLLDSPGRRAAHLWHTLFFLPPETTEYFVSLALDDRGKQDIGWFYGKLVGIDETLGFDGSRGRGPGLATLLRSLPIADASAGLELPGGLRLWSRAAGSSERMPKRESELQKRVRDWSKGSSGDLAFLIDALASRVQIGPIDTPALPRVVRTAGLFRDEALLTPENVVLLAPASDLAPMALAPLERMALRDPRTVRDYLLCLAHLEALEHRPEKYLLISNFQGGVELIRLLFQAGKTDAALLEDHLRQWIDLHLAATDPFEPVAAQLAWFDSLLSALPSTPEDAPGRGPLERALLSAIVARSDPQRFEWKGLGYTAHRGLDLATRMALRLERQAIPSADLQVSIHRGLVALQDACAAADLEATKRIVSELLASFDRLPTDPIGSLTVDPRLRPWFEFVDRPVAVEALRSLERVIRPAALPKMVRVVNRVQRLMARELRPLLLAPAYVAGLEELPGLLLDDAGLIFKHTMIQTLGVATPILGDSPWRRARVIPGKMSPVGTRLAGHVGGISEALAEFHFSRLRGEGGSATLIRQQLWFQDLISTRWHELTPAHSQAVRDVVQAGDQRLRHARSQGGADLDLLLDVASPARVERWLRGEVGPISISERFIMGLESATPEQRRRLQPAGAPTVRIDGRSHRWVGRWPAYEAVESEGVLEALVERELIDLRLALIHYLGEHELPGEIGADLMRRTLEDMTDSLQPETRFDWETVIGTIDTLDTSYFDKKMRQCLEDGLYSIAEF